MANVPFSGTGRTAKATDLPEKQSGKFFVRRLDSPNHPETARIFVAFGATDYLRAGPTITSIAPLTIAASACPHRSLAVRTDFPNAAAARDRRIASRWQV
jgi:hypothetical protein